MTPKQIFIVGTGRSGTTVLRKIVGKHSRIHAFEKELRFITDANGLVDLAQVLTVNWNPFNASEAIVEFRELMLEYLWKQRAQHTVRSALYLKLLKGTARKYRFSTLSNTIPYSHCERTLNDFIDRITLGKVPGYWYGSKSYQTNPMLYVTRQTDLEALYPIMGAFVDDLLSYPLEGTAKTCWCDDTPINILNAHHIAKMFDGARIIHIYRDPRDVVASYADPRQTWAPNDPILSAHWVAEIMEKWKNCKKNISSSKYIEIKYGDIIKEQKYYTKKIVNFLGLDFEDSLLEIELVAGSKGRYKTDISSSVLSEVSRILEPVIKEYGF